MTDSLELLLRALGETEARAVLLDVGTRGSRQAFERLAAVAFARRLLDKGMTRQTVTYEVAARYGVSIESAYRRSGEALNRPA